MRSRLALARIGLVLALVIALGSMPTHAQQQPRSGGTLSLPLIDNARVWPVVGGVPNLMVYKAAFNMLIRYNDQDLLPVGDLAERWTIGPDGKVYTFTLRRNVRWHDGRPFTADDVVFTVNRIWTNPDVPFYLRGNIDVIERAEKVDEATVRLHLKVPSFTLPWMLGYLLPILPEHILKDWSPAQLINPTPAMVRSVVGTGPFKLAELVPGSHARVVRNDDYYAGRPFLDAILYRVIPDLDQQLAQLQAGQLDFMPLDPRQLSAVQNNPNIRINEARQVNYTYIGFHNRLDPFKDRRVRQALTHAIDREALMRNVIGGKGMLSNHPISPWLEWAYNEKVKGLEYSIVKAMALLDEAGWKVNPQTNIRENAGKPLKIILETDKGDPAREQTAVIAQQYWKAVGADVEIRMSLFNALLARVRAGVKSDVKAHILWYVTPPHPDITAYYGCGQSTNTFHYCNPLTDRILAQARRTPDQKQQVALYRQVQERISADAPVVFLYHPFELQALNRNVQGWGRFGFRDTLNVLNRVWKSQ
ncbi:MAG: hypothetical protein FJX78_07980 [Armatimonadetes bacterium]|nr:hypothetical protein [Armatimonadota bacterium]